LLGIWWFVNLWQAASTELANDEAYYVMFSERLAWGYFDHPPVTALLVRLGSFLGGTLGVRLFFTLLQPLYLYILWLLIRPADASKRDAGLFVLICTAVPILQLYGFIAVPDGPLMMGTALFLLCYKRFVCRDNWLNTFLLALSIAFMAYSKYHGALVVVLVLLSNLRLFRQPKIYAAGVMAAIMLIPHLLWQYHNDFVSFAYHLSGRNNIFRIGYVVEFILNLIAVFNPLCWPLYIKGWRPAGNEDHVVRALKFIVAGFTGFFVLSSLRGYVQPQWVIPITFGLVALIFNYVRSHERARRYTMRVGYVTIVLIALFRIVMAYNPLSLKFEIFDNKAIYGGIAEIAEGRPVIFRGSYAIAAKYRYYTGGEAYGQPSVDYRTSQWGLRDDDSQWIGQAVVIETIPEQAEASIRLHDGREFSYRIAEDFRPVRRVAIEPLSDLPKQAAPGQNIELYLALHNPYPYPVTFSADSLPIVAVWKDRLRRINEQTVINRSITIPANGRSEISISFTVPALDGGKYSLGLAIKPPFGVFWYNSKVVKTEITADTK
jgi:hypothetical protein